MNTYYDILSRLKENYKDFSGAYPDENSEAECRLSVMAGEIHALYCQLDSIKRSMFVSTASGSDLDKHAFQRGLSRHQGNKASGTIVVRVDSPLEYDLSIPAGTVFSTSDGELEYVSIEDAFIYRGSGSTFVSVQAKYSGSRFNVPSSSVTTVVTYFSSGISITNSSAISGGTDDETDESLRKRVIDSFRNISNGLNPAFYRKLAESVSGVFSTNIVENADSGNAVNLFVAAKGGAADAATVRSVQELIEENRIPGVNIRVYSAYIVTIDVSIRINIQDNYIVNNARSNAENAVRKFFSELKVGEDLKLNKLGAQLIAADGIENYSFVNMADVSTASSALLKLGSITITTPAE